MTDLSDDVTPMGTLSLENFMGFGRTDQPPTHGIRPTSQDRNGLIERIKRVQSPLWQFRQDVSRQSVSMCCRERSFTKR